MPPFESLLVTTNIYIKGEGFSFSPIQKEATYLSSSNQISETTQDTS